MGAAADAKAAREAAKAAEAAKAGQPAPQPVPPPSGTVPKPVPPPPAPGAARPPATPRPTPPRPQARFSAGAGDFLLEQPEPEVLAADPLVRGALQAGRRIPDPAPPPSIDETRDVGAAPVHTQEAQEAPEARVAQAATTLSTQERARRLLADEGIIAATRGAGGRSDQWIRDRTAQILQTQGTVLPVVGERTPAQQRAYALAEQTAVEELATLRTVGAWASPIYYEGTRSSGGSGPSWGQALGPRVEVIGVDRSGAPVFSQQGPGSWALDVLTMPAYAAAAIPGGGDLGAVDTAAQAIAGRDRDAPVPPVGLAALQERRTFTDVARSTAPETWYGRGLTALAGAAADVLFPDPVTIGHGVLAGARALRGAGKAAAAAPDVARLGTSLEDAARAADAVPPVSAEVTGDLRRAADDLDLDAMQAGPGHSPATGFTPPPAVPSAVAAADKAGAALESAARSLEGVTSKLPPRAAEVVQSRAASILYERIEQRLLDAGADATSAAWVRAALLPGATPGTRQAGNLAGGVSRWLAGGEAGTTALRSPAAALRNLGGRLAIPEGRGLSALLREGVAPRAVVPSVAVVADEARAALVQALEDTRQVVQGAGGVPAAGVAAAPPPTVMGIIKEMRGADGAERVARDLAAGTGPVPSGATVEQVRAGLSGASDAGASGWVRLTERERAALARAGARGEVFAESAFRPVTAAEMAQMDALMRDQAALRRGTLTAPGGARSAEATATGAAATLARKDAAGIGRAILDVLRLPVVGVDAAKDAAWAGLTAHARTATLRITRTIEGGAARYLVGEGAKVATKDALLASLTGGVPERLLGDDISRVATALYSPQALSRVVGEILPGAEAHALSVLERQAKTGDPTTLLHLVEAMPADAPADALRRWGAWLSGHGDAAVPIREAFGDGMLLTRQEADTMRALDEMAAARTTRAPGGGTPAPGDLQGALAATERVGATAGTTKRGLRDVSGVLHTTDAALRDALADMGAVLTREQADQIAKAGRDAIKQTGPSTATWAEAATRLWSRGVTRGAIAARPGYLLNNLFGNIEQVYIQLGVKAALQHAIRNELVSLVGVAIAAAPQAARLVPGAAGMALSEAAHVGLATAMGTGRGKAAVTALMDLVASAPEKLARLLHLSACQVEVSKIIGGTGDTITLGGRRYTYRDLYNEASSAGVFDSFDTSLRGEVEGLLRGLAAIPAEGVAHLAETISTRQRVGLYATLLDAGMHPRQAAEAVVAALYDYRHTMSEAERGTIRWLVAPFWSWQKNAQRQILGALCSPGGAYRTLMIPRMREATADLLDQWYASDYDASGVAVARMTPEEADAYQRLVVPYLAGRSDLADGRARSAFIEGFRPGTVEADALRLSPDLVAALSMAQSYHDPIAWRASLPGWQREQARWRLAPGAAQEAGGRDIAPWARTVWTAALPPSAVDATARWVAGGLAVVAALGQSLTMTPRAPSAVDVFREQVIDPARMPLVSTLAKPRVPISSGLAAFLSWLDVLGVAPDVEQAHQYVAGREAPRRQWYVTDPALATALEASGALAADALMRRGELLTAPGVPVSAAILGVLGFQVSELSATGGTGFEMRQVQERQDQVMTVDPLDAVRSRTLDAPTPTTPTP